MCGCTYRCCGCRCCTDQFPYYRPDLGEKYGPDGRLKKEDNRNFFFFSFMLLVLAFGVIIHLVSAMKKSPEKCPCGHSECACDPSQGLCPYREDPLFFTSV